MNTFTNRFTISEMFVIFKFLDPEQNFRFCSYILQLSQSLVKFNSLFNKIHLIICLHLDTKLRVFSRFKKLIGIYLGSFKMCHNRVRQGNFTLTFPQNRA
ncbi:hypothetical protein B879_03122 [Cecembia lonarensis LW9]|uniref:Uncharacterized protein n=1 Tax=Cecembia lonarensis (strain CCUG 58316 / KCTC 22772 / LW9) TaxID=1225176 RepID=K1LVY0_CECL9|nr:hypothetical protein B879_03122 [Cecembia lonarensis LW9]